MFKDNNSFLPGVPIVRYLLLINALLFLATQILASRSIDLNYYLGMHYWGANMFNPAQMITYMFMHGGWSHIFFNMFGLFMFGRILEMRLGSKRFLLYYMITGIGAGIVQQIVWSMDIVPILQEVNNQLTVANSAAILAQKEIFLNHFITVGASGSIFGLLLAFGMLFPNEAIYIMFIPIPIKAKYFVVIYAVIELMFGVGNFSFDNVAHFAHLGGMLFGFALLWYWRRKYII